MMATSVLFLVLSSFVSVNAFQFYQDRIPNGELVPHPCKPNYLWKGVGHLNVNGGGDRNPFGQDFARYGRTWNRELCQMDSDGDGKTNGEELGDPRCEWTQDGGAPSQVATGHPGVCEPVQSDTCKMKNAAVREDWEFCEQGEFECDAIKSPDVKNFTIAITKGTQVPAQETTYMCQLVKLPDDQQYHIIANKPAIDNQVIAHHIIVYGCDESALETLSHYSSPQICDSMAVYAACHHSVGGWTVGQSGYCEEPNVGTRFGKRVFNYAVIEIHWNNPMEEENYVDGSGLTIFYTPNLRKYDAQVLTIGQQSLAIPPNADTHYQSAVCTKDCTKGLGQAINLYSVNLHMHYLGRAGRVEHWRNGSLLQVLADETRYSYDSPVDYRLDPPAQFMAGDELKMFCKFKSNSKNEMTYFGEGTSDEMCYAFINYYPKTTFSNCVSYGPLDTCEDMDDQDVETQMYVSLKKMGCDMASYEAMIANFSAQAATVCGYENAKCTPECARFFELEYSMQPCLRNGLRFMFESFIEGDDAPETEEYLKFLRLCDKEIIPVKASLEYYEKDNYQLRSAGTSGLKSSACLLFSMLSAMTLVMFLGK